MPKNRKSLGSNLARVDATTDEEIARHMAEDDAPELTDEQLDAAELFEGERFRAAGRPTEGERHQRIGDSADRPRRARPVPCRRSGLADPPQRSSAGSISAKPREAARQAILERNDGERQALRCPTFRLRR